MVVARPLSLQLADPAVADTFLHALDTEVLSADGSLRLRVMRSRDTGERVFLVVDGSARGERVDSVLLDKSQAAYLRDGIAKAVGSMKHGHSVVLRGIQFAAREANAVAAALDRYVEEG